MRDKKRIPKILKELEQIWKNNPDLRLGQLIMIATRPKNICPEVFYIEDEIILKGIKSIGKKVKDSVEKKSLHNWELYPEIIRIKVEDVTYELVKKFLDSIRKEKPNQILTAKSMMKLVGAPVEDSGWLEKQKNRIERLDSLLIEFEKNDEIERTEIGFKIKL